MASNPKEPYGDVQYADPGYQQDGKKRYPLDSAEHVRAAWSYINQADNADQYSAEHLAQVKDRIRAAAKRFGVEIADAQRADDLFVPATWATTLTRAFPLTDLSLRRGRITCESCGQDATGRMVDHYIAPFGEQTEVHDQHGDYIEELDPTAFNKRLADLSRSAAGVRGVGVYYNHAKTLYDTPSEMWSVPVGHPAVIRADGRGLLGSTHYSRDDAAERIFQGVVDGNIAGHSFTGRIVRSNPDRVPRRARSGSLPVVRRMELGLTEYGPTPMPYYTGTPVVAVRSTLSGQHFEEPLATTPPLPSGAGSEEPHADALRSAEIRHAQALRRARIVLIGEHTHGQADQA